MDQSKETATEFERVTNEFLQLLSSFTQKQINMIPFEGSWTGAQVGRHLSKSLAFTRKMIQGTGKKTERAPDEKVEGIKDVFLNFNTKLKSPDFIIPEDINYEKERLLNAFKDESLQIIKTAKTKNLSETCVDLELPVIGPLTRLESISFGIFHTQRHIHQLKNIHQKVTAKKLVN